MALFHLFSSNALLFVVIFCASSNNVLAFMQPKAFIKTRSCPAPFSPDFQTSSKPLQMLPNDLSAVSSLLLSDDAAAIEGANSALAGLRTFFVVITALVFGFAGLTFVTAAFIVPKAAEQLENDTKRLRPGLWEEFEEKLGEGETMATRPDLLQELGNIMQPIIIKDFEDSANAKDVAKADVVDVEVTQKTTIGDADQWKD